MATIIIYYYEILYYYHFDGEIYYCDAMINVYAYNLPCIYVYGGMCRFYFFFFFSSDDYGYDYGNHP